MLRNIHCKLQPYPTANAIQQLHAEAGCHVGQDTFGNQLKCSYGPRSMKTIFGMPYGGQQTVRKASDIPDGPFGTTISWQESVARSATVKKHCEQFQQFFLKGFLS